MIMRGQDIYSSQDEATTSPSSSESEEAKGEESSEEIYPQEDGQPLVVKEKCKEVSVSSKRLAKKETHFTIKTNIKETFPLRQPPHFLFYKKTLVSTATPLGLEVIPQVKELLDEGLVRKRLNPCALLVPKIGAHMGHLSDQGVPTDPKRIKVIPDWPPPPSIREIWGFHDLTNFYKREWQPKVTAISESKDLSSMSLATLFGKLQEHKMELQRLNQNEENDKKKRSIALKASSSMQDENEEEDSDDEEDFSFFVKKFQKFIKKRRIDRRQNFNNGRKSQDDSQVLRCYKCNQIGHIKANCPSNEEWPEKSEKKRFDERRTKKAYIAWDDNDSSDGSEKEINLLTKDYESDENISQE
ncbi:hypothetical protein HKD37_13G035746 [Glycine soja]